MAECLGDKMVEWWVDVWAELMVYVLVELKVVQMAVMKAV